MACAVPWREMELVMRQRGLKTLGSPIQTWFARPFPALRPHKPATANRDHVAHSLALEKYCDTGRGADTAMILRPEVSSNIIKTKIDRLICKPIE